MLGNGSKEILAASRKVRREKLTRATYFSTWNFQSLQSRSSPENCLGLPICRVSRTAENRPPCAAVAVPLATCAILTALSGSLLSLLRYHLGVELFLCRCLLTLSFTLSPFLCTAVATSSPTLPSAPHNPKAANAAAASLTKGSGERKCRQGEAWRVPIVAPHLLVSSRLKACHGESSHACTPRCPHRRLRRRPLP